jgi:hypothetical protein
MDHARKLSIPPAPSSLVELRLEPGVYHYSAWQGISIGVWVGQATLPAVRGILEFGQELRRRYPNGHSSIIFILDKVAAPTPDARELLARLMNAQSSLSCSAVILEGSGFWASGIRSMIGNTHRTASSNVLLRVGTSLDEVLPWFPAEHARLTGIQVDPEELRAMLLHLREKSAAAALGA